MKQTNTLIVGQGIAGSLMAYMLHLKKIPFVVMDPGCNNTASSIAAGMFTPVTGKRRTIQADSLQQIPFAISTYRGIELLLGTLLLHLQDVFHVFSSIEEKNELLRKSGEPVFSKYIVPCGEPLPDIKQPLGAISITHSGWVDCPALITGMRKWLTESGAWINDRFYYPDLVHDKHMMQYGRLQFQRIIFCEGYQGMENPFSTDKIIPCKGDVLTIECRDISPGVIVKKSGKYLVSLGGNKFKAGATYLWHNQSLKPDDESADELKQNLNELLEKEYIVTDHQTGIRPTTVNREVIALKSPVYENIFMLNGLGTRGVIQAPWWASRLAETHF